MFLDDKCFNLCPSSETPTGETGVSPPPPPPNFFQRSIQILTFQNNYISINLVDKSSLEYNGTSNDGRNINTLASRFIYHDWRYAFSR